MIKRINKYLILLLSLTIVTIRGVTVDDVLKYESGENRSGRILPEAVRNRANSLLEGIHENDAKYLRIDSAGDIYYVEPTIFDKVDKKISLDIGDIVQSAIIPDEIYYKAQEIKAIEVFSLHSLPGAPNVIYLDFDGEIVKGRAWGDGATFYCGAFDIDGNPNNWSQDELKRIMDIHGRITEDFAPWNIDVTTERPKTFTSQTVHTLITIGNGSMPSGTAGGVAYLDVFGKSNYNYYSPAFVYYNHLGPSNPKYITEAASHEIGHNLGLTHDGTSSTGYFPGMGNGQSGWAPIMGIGYYQPQTQWSKGEYPDANNKQDDIEVITSKLGLIPLQKNKLNITPGILGTSCPFYFTGKGIVRSSNESEVWGLTFTQPYTVSVEITPYTSKWNPNYLYRGNNLDIKLKITKESLDGPVVLVSNPPNDPSVSALLSVTTGSHYFIISGDGDPTIPFSNYGSLGQYTIKLCFQVISVDNILQKN